MKEGNVDGDRIIAFCGLVCTECPAYVATQAGDQKKLSQLALEWGSGGQVLSAEDCLCSGCKGRGLLASFVGQCKIRRCARDRGVETCGHCPDYPCGLLEETFRRSPEAKAVLDEIATRL
jgi:hypothetical protein